jgi:asparagine synthase (glutamine-hydrolysing)
MCGIVGVYWRDGRPAEESFVRAMNETLRHRGPDEEGVLIDGPFGFGMRRLSIIDLKSGSQPIGNEDGSIQVVLNGEIYNYRELAETLCRRGHVLRTTSDTEVIVHLYEEYGTELVQHLRGMFAFAVWDRRRRRLVLGRDRLGIKPLYYAHTSHGLIFASELKAISQVTEIASDIDPDAVISYLRYGYVPEPMSIFRDVRKLAAGELLVFEGDGAPHASKYWDPIAFFKEPRETPSPESLVEELQWRLRDAVRSHLVSDVPIGAFLSGGVDSSTVVALMAAEGGSVATFSIGFRESEFNELPYARIVAQRFGTEHRELVAEPQSPERLEAILAQFDEPFGDPSAIPTYFVSMLAGREVKVTLSGDGGDELFAGYDRYVVDHRRARLGWIAGTPVAPVVRRLSERLPEGTRGKNLLYSVGLPRTERYLDDISRFGSRRLALIAADRIRGCRRGAADGVAEHFGPSDGLPFVSRLQYLDMKTYLPGDILTKVDRMSMAHSVEARVPLLDHRLVEFAASIPASYHLHRGETKYLFKRAIQGLLPDEVVNRPKRGFAVPLAYWFSGDWHELLGDMLLAPGSMSHGFFDVSYVEGLYRLYQASRREDVLHRLWTLLAFEIWYRRIPTTRNQVRCDAR